MLFSRRRHTIKRILIVEDEPLVAFDDEHFLRDRGFEVVATVDRAEAAVEVIAKTALDLVLADVRLSGGDGGLEVARAARRKGVPVLFATAACPPASTLAIGCLTKPYSQRALRDAITAVEAKLTGLPVRRVPPGLTLYDLEQPEAQP